MKDTTEILTSSFSKIVFQKPCITINHGYTFLKVPQRKRNYVQENVYLAAEKYFISVDVLDGFYPFKKYDIFIYHKFYIIIGSWPPPFVLIHHGYNLSVFKWKLNKWTVPGKIS